MKESEAKLSEIYHPLWEKFNSEQYGQSVSLFAGRLIVNGFDISWFENKVCLDAGCGSGRYIQAMLDLKAKEVIGLDLNPAIAISKINDSRAKILSADLRKISYPDQHFDFVCCNGVLHHTENPKEILNELGRVLKINGYMFLFVFDPYNADWEMIDALRAAAQKFPMERLQNHFKKHLNLPENVIYNYCDLMYAPIQIKFTREELLKMLKGYEVHFMEQPYASYDSKNENRLFARKLIS